MQYSRNSSRSSDRELSLCREGAGLAKGSGVCYNPAVAEVAEWQTRRIQNPLPLKACGFKSRLRHTEKPVELTSTGFSLAENMLKTEIIP